jgi:hypothetical protein
MVWIVRRSEADLFVTKPSRRLLDVSLLDPVAFDASGGLRRRERGVLGIFRPTLRLSDRDTAQDNDA